MPTCQTSYPTFSSSRRSTSSLVLVGLLLSFAAEKAARGHGGLPVSQQILRQGPSETLHVGVLYWGLFVGKAGGPWRLMCEEQINNNRLRRYGLSPDGALYATDTQGVTFSTDKGCTWTAYQGGDLATLAATDVATDPQDGATAYVVTGSSAADNSLFITHDHGTSWNRAAGLGSMPGRQFLSVRVAPADAQTLYVTSRSSTAPYSPMLHRTKDRGATFTALPITYQLEGVTPLATEVLAIDPRNKAVLYVRAFSETRHALLRSIDGGTTFAEIWKMDGVTVAGGQSRGIDGVAVDASSGQIWVATAAGLLKGNDPNPGGGAMLQLEHTGNLSQARCIEAQGDALYACSSQFTPDFAAVARSQDGNQPWQSVLNYTQAAGPVECPTGTPMGDNCPSQWEMFKSQLGVGLQAVDAGVVPDPPPSGSSCSFQAGTRCPSPLPQLVLLVAASLLLMRRRYGVSEK